jgi:predicted dehydrogenase
MKICLAGTGAMGAIHMKALGRIEDVQVVSIAARTDASAQAFAGEWKIPFGSTDLEACIDTERPARGADAAGAREGQTRSGRDPHGAEPG